MARGAELVRSTRAWLVLAFLAALAASWAWWPHAGWGAAPRCTAVLLDVSASVVRTRPGWAAWRDEQLARELAATPADRSVLVAAFADGFEVLAAPARPNALASERLPKALLRDGAAECAAALRSLGELAGDLALVRVLVLSDGAFTGPDPGAAIDELRRRGAEYELRTPPPPSAVDLELAELRAPRELEAGAPLALAARVRSRGSELPSGARAVLEVMSNDVRGERTSRRTLDARALAAGETRVSVDLGPLAAGLTSLRARLAVEGAADVAPENDERAAHVRSREALVVRVIAPRPTRYLSWLEELRSVDGLHLLPPRAELDPASLAECDVLVTLDVDPRELEASALRSFVASGGGWLALGQHALASALASSASEASTALLPLELRESPARDVVLLLDGSGSMDAAALDELRAASLALARAVASGETLRLWWFTDRLHEAFELEGGFDERASERNRASWARQTAPGGPTDIAAVLAEFARRREGGREALVFLISDGRDQRARTPPAGWPDELFAELSRANARLAVIAAGAGADREWLDELARPTAHGRAWSARDTALGEVLERESVRDQLAPQGGVVAVVDRSRVRDGEARALLESWSARAPLPRAGPALSTRAREGDELVAELPDGAPWLALRRHGMGWCAVLTGEPTADSSPEWERASALFAPLLRLLGRTGASEPRARPRARRDAQGRWRVDGLPTELPEEVALADASQPQVRISAHVPHDVNALDPRTQRVAASPGLAGAREVVLFSADGAELARAPTAPEHAEEFSGAVEPWNAGRLAPLGDALAQGLALPPARRRLGLVAALVSLAALAAGLACSNPGLALAARQVGAPSRR